MNTTVPSGRRFISQNPCLTWQWLQTQSRKKQREQQVSDGTAPRGARIFSSRGSLRFTWQKTGRQCDRKKSTEELERILRDDWDEEISCSNAWLPLWGQVIVKTIHDVIFQYILFWTLFEVDLFLISFCFSCLVFGLGCKSQKSGVTHSSHSCEP